MRVRDKVVVVTGAGSGIGRALVLELLARGARVAGVGRRRAALEETARQAEAGERFSIHPGDVTEREAVAALPEAVIAHHGAVDMLINNAGVIQPFTPLAALDDATIERVMQINFYGVLHMVRAFLPHLRARPEAHVVNVSSMGGFVPFPGQTIYCASKAAVKMLTEGLYAELLETSVKVSVALPGAVDTDIVRNSGVGGGDIADAQDSPLDPLPPAVAARQLLDGVERDRLHILIGKDAKGLSLMRRIAPGWVIRFLQRQLRDRYSGQDGTAG